MTISHRLPLFFVASAGFLAAPACHSAFAYGADSPKTVTPSIDIEIEDRGPGSAGHTARFNMSLLDGHADLNAVDGDAHYGLSAQTITEAEPKLSLKVKRTDRSPATEIFVSGSISAQPGERIVVARIDRADGHTTTVLARAH